MEKINWYVGLSTVVMVLFAVAFLLLFLFYQKYLLKIKKQEAEMLLKVSLQSEKKERKRIAADLHDGVLGDLAATRNFLKIISKKINTREQKELIAELEEALNDTLSNTRAVCYKLIPPLLENYGLRLALMDYIEKLNNSSTTKFSIDFPESYTQYFDHDKSYEIYRILQEFTTNCIKYGNATYFQISIDNYSDRILFNLKDDGESYDFFSLYKTSTGNGIKNILSRVQAIDAKLEQTKVLKGNHLIISIPIKK